MSRRKYITQQSLTQEVQPPGPDESIVRALGARGGNIVEVEHPDGRATLVLMPARFNKKLWVRRGGFLIIDESAEAQEDASSRVTGTIVSVLYDEHVRKLQKLPGVWPPEFQAGSSKAAAVAAEEEEEEEDEDDEGEEEGGAPELVGLPGAAAAAAAAGGRGGGGGEGEGDDDTSSEDSLEPLHQNSNRKVIYYEVSESEEEEDDDGDGEDGGGAGGDAAAAAAARQGRGSGGGAAAGAGKAGRLADEEVERVLEELGGKLAACELGKRSGA
ncbi:MAG: hypothetical protein J3K34DRAFT_520188 [Monoraphidium minutum]|nr:MAG: hypothetical protein J3K34DRAFT_520188 [Monoraphidium minutum]